MTTARIVKLATGDFLTLMVEGASEVEGQYGKQLRLDGQTAENENVTLFLPLDSALRQFERIGITAASAVSEVLKVEKIEKNGRTFININRAAGSPTNGKGKVAAPPRAEPEWLADQGENEAAFVAGAKASGAPDKFDALAKLHVRCYRHALSLIAQGGAGIALDVTLEGVSALTAQLFIAAREAGL